MGHHHNRCTLLVQLAQQLHHLHTVLRVEVTRRLVGKDDARLAHHGTGYSHTLLLSARELVGIVFGTVTQLHLAQYVEHTLTAFLLIHTKVLQLQVDVLLYGKFVDKVERLEHEAYASLAVGCALLLLQTSHLIAAEPILALGGTVEQSEDIK